MRQWSFVVSFFQCEKVINPLPAPLVGGDGGCCASENQNSAPRCRTLQCNFHGVILRGHIGLITGFVLFVHYDCSDVCKRCKDAHPGTDYNFCLSAANSLPFVISFPLRKPAMHDGNRFLAEPSDKSFNKLSRKRYFRYKHNRGSASVEAFRNHLHIYLGFPACGYSMNQEVLLPAFVNRTFYRICGNPLFAGQCVRLRVISLNILVRFFLFSLCCGFSRRQKAVYGIGIGNGISLFHPCCCLNDLFAEAEVWINALYVFDFLFGAVGSIRNAENKAAFGLIPSAERNQNAVTGFGTGITSPVCKNHIRMFAFVFDYYIYVFHF